MLILFILRGNGHTPKRVVVGGGMDIPSSAALQLHINSYYKMPFFKSVCLHGQFIQDTATAHSGHLIGLLSLSQYTYTFFSLAN